MDGESISYLVVVLSLGIMFEMWTRYDKYSEGSSLLAFWYLCFQVVELDFLYPSEGIHKRWDSGYRITSTAANIDQSALVLSVPKRRPGDETQETLRTSQFPSTHVKVNVTRSFPPRPFLSKYPLHCFIGNESQFA